MTQSTNTTVRVDARNLSKLFRAHLDLAVPRSFTNLCDAIVESSDGAICVGCYGLRADCEAMKYKCCPDCTHTSPDPARAGVHPNGLTEAQQQQWEKQYRQIVTVLTQAVEQAPTGAEAERRLGVIALELRVMSSAVELVNKHPEAVARMRGAAAPAPKRRTRRGV